MRQRFAGAAVLFGEPDYRRLWAVGGLSGIARWLEFLALGVYAYEVTGDPGFVALVAILRFLPFVLLGPFIGALGDLPNRRALLIGSLAILFAASALLAVLTGLGLAGHRTVAAAAFASGIAWLTDMPFRRRLMLDAVERRQVPTAMGFDSATNTATRMIGPLIGGVSYQWLGISGIYSLNAALFLACMILALALPRAAGAAWPGPGSWRLSALVPPRRLLTNGFFLAILGVTLVYNLACFPFFAMLPVLAGTELGLSASGLGLLSAFEGLGATAGAIAFGLFAGNRGLFACYFGGTLGFVVLLFLLSLSLTLEAAFPLLFLIGVGGAFFQSTQYALVYVVAPPELRGRATGLMTLCIGSVVLGFYNAGWLFEHLAAATAMKIMALEGALLLAAIAVLWWRVSRRGTGLD